VEPSLQSNFRKSALASGLVTPEQLDEALAILRSRVSTAPGTSDQIRDDELAEILVEKGPINSWQAEQLLVGRSRFYLGPYRIIDSIGQGGMGQVFKAEHSLMGRVVAIKVLPRHRNSPDAIDGFMREIRAQAQLDHENLVRAYDAGRDGNVYYLVTEYVPGIDLRRLVRKSTSLSMSQAATIISQVARGLEHAHSQGLLHRDVKPGNVLVTHDGKAKLSDLGLSGYRDELDGRDPRSGKIMGTADYLSPEQIMTPRDVSPASDIYSLGCTLYYAVTGKVPFPGGSTRDKIRRHCEDTPLNPRHFNLELDDRFLVLLCDMMEKDPVDRIGTAAEVAHRLEPWVDPQFALPPDGVFERPQVTSYRPALPPGAESLPDTASGDLDFPEMEEVRHSSPSQISQATDPIASASDDTFPSPSAEHLSGYLSSPRPASGGGW
jgi:serine/threonine protein kinase